MDNSLILSSSMWDLNILIQRASEASEADYQSCSIEISDIYIYIYVGMYAYVKKFRPRF